MISAIIFDMDGTLIDSEPLWGIAEEEIYPKLGIPYSHKFADQITGLRTDEAVKFWYDRFPWEGPSVAEVADMFKESMSEKLRKHAPPMPGTDGLMALCEKQGIKMAVASSSAYQLMLAGLDKFGLDRFDVIHSAENEEYGKPHPAVYLSTLTQLKVKATECIAFEDSINGMRAAIRAGIFTIAIPSKQDFNNPTFDEANLKLRSLSEFDFESVVQEVLNQ